MEPLNLARTILALSTLLVVTGEETRFPDFSCHKEYNWEHPSAEGGEKYAQMTVEICKLVAESWGCYQKCVLDGLHIIDENGSLQKEKDISRRLKILFKDHDETVAAPFAKKIVAECRDISEETISLPCDERTKFYDCVDHAAGCK